MALARAARPPPTIAGSSLRGETGRLATGAALPHHYLARAWGALAIERGAVALLAFLLPNLPFLIASPQAWATSLLLPITLPVFPSGIGLIALARGGLLHLWPAAVYAMLELAALAGLLIWFARARRLPRPESALVLGALSLLLAWHSAAGYFVALPALAVYAALPLLKRDIRIAQVHSQ